MGPRPVKNYQYSNTLIFKKKKNFCIGYRLLRHNDQTVLWDKSATRSLDTNDYTLHFNPVTKRVSTDSLI